VLNYAAINYIYNDLSRLEDYRPSITSNRLEAGIQALNIYKYSTTYITIRILNRPAKLRLNNVVYIPGFLANLVYFRRF
jgi:hypothetical protein